MEGFSPDGFLYYAIFHVDEQLIRRAKLQFIRHFDKESFELWLAPYLDCKPGFLFSAPRTKYLYWMLDRLAMLTAEDIGTEYIRHSQLVAPDIPEKLDIINCKRCARPVETNEAKDQLCFICQTDNMVRSLE